MFAMRITNLAGRIGCSIPKGSKLSTTLSNNYRRSIVNTNRRFSRSVSAAMDTTATSTEKDNGSTEEPLITPEQKKMQSLEDENIQLKDKYQRALAERENTRIRMQKEIVDAKIFGIQSFCKDLLEVSDVFKQALENLPKESIENADKDMRNLYDGIVMTETQLHIVFGRHGLSPIVPLVGDQFDPSFQEAMLKMPVSDGHKSGTVANVFRTGWKLKERCIRSAQVSVFKES